MKPGPPNGFVNASHSGAEDKPQTTYFQGATTHCSYRTLTAWTRSPASDEDTIVLLAMVVREA